MLNVIRFEKYRFLHIKIHVLLLAVMSIIINNVFSVYSYRANFFKMTGTDYLESLEYAGFFIPVIIMLFISIIQDNSVKSKLHYIEILSGYSLNKIINGKSLFYSICYVFSVDILYLLEFSVFSFVNGLGGVEIKQVLLQNVCYIIAVYITILYSLYIIYIINDAVKGAFISIIIYIFFAIVSGIVVNVLKELLNVSLNKFNDYLLSGVFPLFFCTEKTNIILLFEKTMIIFIIYYLIFIIIYKLCKRND